MKKFTKILALLLSVCLIVSLTACGQTTVSTVSATNALETTETEENKEEPKAEDYTDDLNGLISYMTDCELIIGDGNDMSADYIGAKEGKQFAYTYGDATVILELYEFDTENLDEKAEGYLTSAKNENKISILGKDVNAKVSESGKFMMLFSISVTGDDYDVFAEKVNNNFTAFVGK